jgi:SpoU rRNA methylase family enzyme
MKLTKRQYIEQVGVVFSGIKKPLAPVEVKFKNKKRNLKSDKVGAHRKYKNDEQY